MRCTNFLIIAHRGASYDAPENTLAAINLAWERDAEAVEIDIHLTKDNKIVVIHDENTWHTAGKLSWVKNQTLEKLKRLDVGKYKGKKWACERIPTLKEVLETVPHNKKLIIEIKSSSEILPVLEADLKNSQLSLEQVVFIGFDLDTMTDIKKNFSQNEVLWIHELEKDKKNKRWKFDIDELINKSQQAGLNGLNIWPGEVINQAVIKKVKAANLKLYVWTINDPVEAKRLLQIGVDGITTDRPQWLKVKLQELITKARRTELVRPSIK